MGVERHHSLDVSIRARPKLDVPEWARLRGQASTCRLGTAVRAQTRGRGLGEGLLKVPELALQARADLARLQGEARGRVQARKGLDVPELIV